jgi:hypothetical protein
MSMMDCIVKYVNGHIEVYDRQHNWIQSADNEEELENDLKQIIEKVMTA